MMTDSAATERTRARLTERLLASRQPNGRWEGHLSSSALSTATATIALKSHDRINPLINRGLKWLIAHQNGDGGWGDTVVSLSNLSTTLLCWAALSTNERAESWLRERLGDLNPENLRNALVQRYGKDRTFSVPILTALALSGRLGPEDVRWKLVPQLPFELAALPHRTFQWVRLPVVSYALPALVAIGHARHHQAPARNPVLRGLRSILCGRTLEVARTMQPDSGGYLEATPLTAFVCMSLIHSGAERHPIVTNGIRFLTSSVRDDGSWPIDTNLSTWVTTLSVNALSASNALPEGDRRRTLHWIRDQQHLAEHPFTHARPGGWAWTNLSGGVPDADDTAGALIALWNLDGPRNLDAAKKGVEWLLALQNSDGGIPTFCRGWGALPFDRSAPDLTAHALEAWSLWHEALPAGVRPRVNRAAERALAYLTRQQQADGSWVPLWFGNQHVADESNPTYGTARVISGLSSGLMEKSSHARHAAEQGRAWLRNTQNEDGGWGGGPGAPSSIEETGLALSALAGNGAANETIARGVRWLVGTTDEGRLTPASPIGLYFARLWYSEDLYPLIFALRGLSAAMTADTTSPDQAGGARSLA